MATKQITTWDEFKTALTERITENTTYEIMNDIDVSDEALTPINTDSNSQTSIVKRFNGNNHKINGLTSYTSSTSNALFVFRRFIRFHDLSFTNFMLQEIYLFSAMYTTSSYSIFNNCFFNGLCYGFMYNNTSGGFVNACNSCSINIKIKYLSYKFITCHNTYIKIQPFSDNDTNSLIGSPNTLGSIGDNNYICGLLRNTLSNLTIYNSGIIFPRSENSVYNIEYIITNNPKTANVQNYNSATYALFNTDKIKNANGDAIPVTTSHASMYLLTDSQLKSKTYIQQNTNFPLYG